MTPKRTRSAFLPKRSNNHQKRITASGSVACCLAVLLLTAWQSPAELVLRYTFDDDTNTTYAADSVAPEAHGMFVGSTARSSDTPNGAGSALDVNFAGQNYATAGDPAKLNNLSAFTITFWINLRAQPLANDRIIDKSSATGGITLRLATGGNDMILGINSTTSVGPRAPAWAALNEWLFYAVTYDGNKTVLNSQWFSGSKTNSVVGAGPATYNRGAVVNTTSDFRVGGTAASTADRTPPAWFDDVRVYNAALSAVEIEAIRREASNLPAEPSVLSFTANGAAAPNPPQSLYVTGSSNIVVSAGVAGAGPLGVQMFYNGLPIPGGTALLNTSAGEFNYVLPNGAPDFAGQYEVIVTNNLGSATGHIHSLEITTLFDSAVMTNLWTVPPGIRDYLPASGNQIRSMAYSPVSAVYYGSGSLIVARWVSAVAKSVQLMDPTTGDTGGLLATTDFTFDMTNGVRGINVVAAADDGAIYVGNLITSATNSPFYLYRYASDDVNSSLPTIAYSGDPGGAAYAGLRWGDNIDARGSGTDTQILLGPGGGTNYGGNVTWATNIVALLRTSNGSSFTSTPILVTNAPEDFAGLSVAFGPGNTFYAKNAYDQLFFVEFNADSGIGWVKHVSNLISVPGSVIAIGTDSTGTQLAGLSLETPDNVRLYDISNKDRDPALLDQAAFETDNANLNVGGVGSVIFGSNVIYVLNCNNGVKAFQLNTNYTQPATFTISSFKTVNSPGVAAVTWPAAVGRTYQAQSSDDLGSGAWARVGNPVTGTGATVTVTNMALTGSVSNRFYRVVAQ